MFSLQTIFFFLILFSFCFVITYTLFSDGKKFKFNEQFWFLLSQILAVCTYLLPFLEISKQNVSLVMAFGPLNYFYRSFIAEYFAFYFNNPLFEFVFFFFLFIFCVRKVLPINNFVRFNIMQSILIFLLASLLNVFFISLPVSLRNSFLGEILGNVFYSLVLYSILYSVFQVLRGRYASIPFVSEAVRLHLDI